MELLNVMVRSKKEFAVIGNSPAGRAGKPSIHLKTSLKLSVRARLWVPLQLSLERLDLHWSQNSPDLEFL